MTDQTKPEAICFIVGAALGIALTATVMAGWQRGHDLKVQRDQSVAVAEAVRQARSVERGLVLGAARVDAATTKATEHTRTITQTLIEKVPVYVTPSTDRAFALAMGLVRVRDAAASGDLSSLAAAPGVDNDSPSGIAPSAFAAVLAEDYGACHDAFDRLDGAQAYIRDQYEIMQKEKPK